MSADRMGRATAKLRGVGRVLDRWFHEGLAWLTTGAVERAAAACALLLCLAVPPLELLSLASAAPLGAIACFGLALTLKDGLLVALDFLLAGAAVLIGFGVLGGG